MKIRFLWMQRILATVLNLKVTFAKDVALFLQSFYVFIILESLVHYVLIRQKAVKKFHSKHSALFLTL